VVVRAGVNYYRWGKVTLNKLLKAFAFCLLLSFLILMNSEYARAQVSASGASDQGRAAQYFLGDRDQVLMPVNVWGFVNKPGQYMVPYETDLISLLSYAGGPQEEAKIKSIKLVRGVKTINGQKDQPEVIEVDVKKYLKTGQSDIIPVLKPGDTVVVNGSTFHFVNRFFDFTWRVATLAQAYALFTYYRK
jgi:hypothetical protein